MEKVVSGKRYNVEKAKEMGVYSGPGYKETLFRKRTGEYFLYGEGGAETRYAEREGRIWKSGKMIIPLTYDEARDWAEGHLDSGLYEAIFGELPEGENAGKLIVTLSVNAVRWEKARREAQKRGIPISEYVESLLPK